MSCSDFAAPNAALSRAICGAHFGGDAAKRCADNPGDDDGDGPSTQQTQQNRRNGSGTDTRLVLESTVLRLVLG